jgi:hypothetical protein
VPVFVGGDLFIERYCIANTVIPARTHPRALLLAACPSSLASYVLMPGCCVVHLACVRMRHCDLPLAYAHRLVLKRHAQQRRVEMTLSRPSRARPQAAEEPAGRWV